MSCELLDLVYIDTSVFSCPGNDGCESKERTVSYAISASVPGDPAADDDDIEICKYVHTVFASSTDPDIYKNDFNGFYHQRQVPSESCNFFLIDLSSGDEHHLDGQEFGVLKDFGSISENPNLKTFILDWRKVLQSLGPGAYKVVKRIGFFLNVFEVEYLVYTLVEFSRDKADKTVRLEASMAGVMVQKGIDFTGSEFVDSIRVKGFFGRRDQSWEEDNLVDKNYNLQQISMIQTNEYKFDTNMIPVQISGIINDFLLFSGNLKVSDYNLNNHSHDYKMFPVNLKSNEGAEYFTNNRNVRLNLVFSDSILNNKKRNYS